MTEDLSKVNNFLYKKIAVLDRSQPQLNFIFYLNKSFFICKDTFFAKIVNNL